ncbi:MAG TPA: M1 family aminopeptidase [Polyangiales bacterium]
MASRAPRKLSKQRAAAPAARKPRLVRHLGQPSKPRAAVRKKPASRGGGAKTREATGLGFRLPREVRPLAYRLHIDVDPDKGPGYSGAVEIEIELQRSVTQLELHAVDLHVTLANIAAAGRQLGCRIEEHPERETLVVLAPRTLDKGKITLRLAFSGTLRTDLRGFYAASAAKRHYAFTQLEAADARRFFPCFDEPSFKARFTVSATTPERNTVISNGAVEHIEPEPGGNQTVHFAQTPPLSTYLVALAVGELEVSEPVYAGPVPIRLVHVPGNGHLTSFALDAARECLTRLTEYFDLPYPYEKLDLVAVPDFEIGAMENAGAVFFRETLLLVDESTVSLAEKKRAAEVICHELAHMWYGNLVTMRWWDDLWLNEAFATWMAFDVVAKWRPEWKMWNDFGHARNSALHLDALDNTHPIYTAVHTPADATENFDLITYEKGAAVVRMLERYLGPAVFQRGVRAYIKRHAEGNTVANDLWVALEEAAGQDVRRVVRAFINTPGFPIVRIERKHATQGKQGKPGKQADELLLTQERFHAHGPRTPKPARNAKKAAAVSAAKAAERWAVPWVGRLGVAEPVSGAYQEQDSLLRHLLVTKQTRLALPASATFVYGNADEGGFFRPLHSEADLQQLAQALPQLSTTERLGLLHHQWALVGAGYASLEAFFALLRALGQEPDADVLHAVLAPCEQLVDDLANSLGEPVRAAMRGFVASVFGQAARELGVVSSAGESDETRLRRAELISLVAVVAEEPELERKVHEQCVRYLKDRRSVDANLAGALLVVGARHADKKRLDSYLAASVSDPTPQERRRFRMAMGDVREPKLVERVLELSLTDKIPTQDVALLLARLLANRSARRATWTFVETHWPALRDRMPAMLVSRLVDATPLLREERYRKEVAAFFASHPVPTAARALRQALERFQLDAAFRKRAAPALQRLLRA